MASSSYVAFHYYHSLFLFSSSYGIDVCKQLLFYQNPSWVTLLSNLDGNDVQILFIPCFTFNLLLILISSFAKEVMFSAALVFVFLSVCLLTTLLKKLWADCNAILWRGLGWYKEHVIRFWLRSRSPCWLLNWKSSNYPTSHERIAMKIYGGVWGGKRNKWLDFGSNMDYHADFPIGNPGISQQIMSGFWWHSQDSSAMIQRIIN